MNRVSVLQAIIDRLSARDYLEIGVRAGDTFLPLRISKKRAVDPAMLIPRRKKLRWIRWNLHNLFNEYYSMPSDAFFTTHGDKLKRRGLDVVFVDGMHTFDQSLRDVQNSLEYLNDRGVIVVDDCNPQSAAAADPNRTQVTWNGDVWKTIAYLRATRSDLDIFTLDCVFGLGIITKQQGKVSLDVDPGRIRSWTYEDLDRERASVLNLKPPAHLDAFLRSKPVPL